MKHQYIIHSATIHKHLKKYLFATEKSLFSLEVNKTKDIFPIIIEHTADGSIPLL